MIEFKACSRCKGDVKTNRDVYGTYRQCLQCGRMQDVLVGMASMEKRQPARSKKHKAA